MSNLRSNEEPAVRFAKLMSELYYFMAQEMVERMGKENGMEAVSSAVNKFGKARIKAMKEEAKERGLDADDARTYAAVRDMPSTGWKCSADNPLETTYCPMADIWQQYGKGGMELGHLYCEIDHILFEAFGMKLERPYCIAKGDKVCKFNLKRL
ncbi:L-2-amino-thiazoline-4-carboxylic acid hydrolase [Clostridium sp. P21]|uniref:L-2-amino-thiazoline-4-carboxylic acid hydrolase n=1 Tax=Clostridium muellerianum TaxID=2716538 RepID=A0A7Y0EE12_9CLOT|nr:L-2-amino-thiazoline-4-carboxylic acid hydrolase [Clostridium muellerianum]NMM61715.1 L-2-amino-thiazoline-4-carboxylic acid hydrolase [Clostridium muellerianum]